MTFRSQSFAPTTWTSCERSLFRTRIVEAASARSLCWMVLALDRDKLHASINAHVDEWFRTPIVRSIGHGGWVNDNALTLWKLVAQVGTDTEKRQATAIYNGFAKLRDAFSGTIPPLMSEGIEELKVLFAPHGDAEDRQLFGAVLDLIRQLDEIEGETGVK